MKFKFMSESIEVHDCLNPVLWQNDELKPQVLRKLVQIVDKYVENSDLLSSENIVDVELVGSNASYNYTADSDLDVHLVVNMEFMSADPALFQTACNIERSNFNKNYNIKIRGIDVELYVEDVNAATASNGIYSLMKQEWIKYPVKIDVPDMTNNTQFNEMLAKWSTKAQNILNNSTNTNEVQVFINELYNLRRLSIMTDGEYSIGNLVFKEIRNEGLLDSLKEKLHELTSRDLSLESLKQ